MTRSRCSGRRARSKNTTSLTSPSSREDPIGRHVCSLSMILENILMTDFRTAGLKQQPIPPMTKYTQLKTKPSVYSSGPRQVQQPANKEQEDKARIASLTSRLGKLEEQIV